MHTVAHLEEAKSSKLYRLDESAIGWILSQNDPTRHWHQESGYVRKVVISETLWGQRFYTFELNEVLIQEANDIDDWLLGQLAICEGEHELFHPT